MKPGLRVLLVAVVVVPSDVPLALTPRKDVDERARLAQTFRGVPGVVPVRTSERPIAPNL